MKVDELIRFGRCVVMHKREKPFVHAFVYRLFCLQLRVDRMSELQAHGSWLFGVNRARLVSFMSADHGDRRGSDLMNWLHQQLASVGLQHPGGETWLQCFPRMFGYVFNPVSFWMMHDTQGQLRLILAEVNNTFGQRHQYALQAPGGTPIDEGVALVCVKQFHVSPFCEIKGHYRFRYQGRINVPLESPEDGGHRSLSVQGAVSTHQSMAIDLMDDESSDVPLLRTAISVRPESWTTHRLLAAVLKMPLMTMGVMLRIHWQAFKLWRKGAAFFQLPPEPANEVTRNAPS